MPPPVPDLKQLKLKGFKPKVIAELEELFDRYMDARMETSEAMTRRTDTKEALKRGIQNAKLPGYGKRYRGKLWVATRVADEDLAVKRQSKDREV